MPIYLLANLRTPKEIDDKSLIREYFESLYNDLILYKQTKADPYKSYISIAIIPQIKRKFSKLEELFSNRKIEKYEKVFENLKSELKDLNIYD